MPLFMISIKESAAAENETDLQNALSVLLYHVLSDILEIKYP